ncbi:MAG: LysR family transcriptional regulator [Pseudomonadota bacterium]
MNIEHIRAFLEVASTGSFQMAAGKLHITQSTVSARIKALEEQLNRSLFYRKRNGIELTAGGKQFHASAVNVVRSWETGRQAVSLPDDVNTIICLGIEDNHWQKVTHNWLVKMEEELPTIASTVFAASSADLMTRLKSGFLDLAVIYEPQFCEEVSIENITTEKLIMVSRTSRSVEHGVVPGYVFVDWGETFRSQHRIQFPGVFNHKLTTGNASTALEYVLSNDGSGYFMESMVRPLVEANQLHIVKDAPHFIRPVYLGIRKEASAPNLVSIAAEAVRTSLSEFEN